MSALIFIRCRVICTNIDRSSEDERSLIVQIYKVVLLVLTRAWVAFKLIDILDEEDTYGLLYR